MAVTGLRIGSLCSGYGGLDLGVQAVLGGDVAWHVEYDKDPSRILHHRWPTIPNHGDVKITDWTRVEPVDVLTAGYPFQLGNNESPADWIARRADVVLRTGTHHGLPLPVAAWSIAEGHPIRLSDPTSWSPDHAEPGRFGPYEGAVARWEGVLRRTAPDPTRPDGREGRPRLNPAFVEWMMGLDPGHVTDVPELSRNAQLKALGNGVVPQQAALALRLLLPLLGE